VSVSHDATPRPGALLFAPADGQELAREIARLSGAELAPLEEREFEAGEFKLRPLTSVRGRAVHIVQTLAGTPTLSASERLVRLLFLLFGLRDAGAASVTALIPYLAFARKDRRTQPRDPVSSRYVAQLIESAGPDRVVALDVHNPAAFDNAFRVPTDHLSALSMFTDQIAKSVAAGTPVAIASPDVGGIKRAQLLREQLERRLERSVDLLFVEKRRALGVVSGGAVCGEPGGKTVIVVDDLCASGGTLLRAARALREAGASQVHVAFTHAPSPAGLSALAASPDIGDIMLTDSVGAALAAVPTPARQRLRVLGVAPLLAQAITR
jgi:ribose-phosphate pyrophosphokinase